MKGDAGPFARSARGCGCPTLSPSAPHFLTRSSLCFASLTPTLPAVESALLGNIPGLRVYKSYELGAQMGSAGPGLAFRVYDARPRKGGARVSVWLLDKRALAEGGGQEGRSRRQAAERFAAKLKAGAARMGKLRHPGVLRLVEAPDESRAGLALVTEPVLGSVANFLGRYARIARVPAALKAELSELEAKVGVLQLLDALAFLHGTGLTHASVSPDSVVLTPGGQWKLSGFEFAESAAGIGGADALPPGVGGGAASQQGGHFRWDEGFEARGMGSGADQEQELPEAPALAYTAPEIVAGGVPTPAADVFSLCALLHELLERKPLLACGGDLLSYKREVERIGTGAGSAFPRVPAAERRDLCLALAPNAAIRPASAALGGVPFFAGDASVRIVRFLSRMLERDPVHKAQFLQMLLGAWRSLPPRVLELHVLPPLLAELRDEASRVAALKVVLQIAESQDQETFVRCTLLGLQPVCASADGEALVMLLRALPVLVERWPDKAATEADLLAMVVRAIDSPVAVVSGEGLRAVAPVAAKVDYAAARKHILPRLHERGVRGTTPAARVAAVEAMRALAEGVFRGDRQTLELMCQSLGAVAQADSSAVVVAAVVKTGEVIAANGGLETAATKVLPLLCPLLVSRALTGTEFGALVATVRGILETVEAKYGGQAPVIGAAGSGGAVSAGAQRLPASGSSVASKPMGNWDDDLKVKALPGTTPAILAAPSGVPSSMLPPQSTVNDPFGMPGLQPTMGGGMRPMQAARMAPASAAAPMAPTAPAVTPVLGAPPATAKPGAPVDIFAGMSLGGPGSSVVGGVSGAPSMLAPPPRAAGAAMPAIFGGGAEAPAVASPPRRASGAPMPDLFNAGAQALAAPPAADNPFGLL